MGLCLPLFKPVNQGITVFFTKAAFGFLEIVTYYDIVTRWFFIVLFVRIKVLKCNPAESEIA